MRLKISHRTDYSYASPVQYALQRIRLMPRNSPTQAVLSWGIDVDGAVEEVRYRDQFDNDTRLLSVQGQAHEIAIIAQGEVETRNSAGVEGPHSGFAPLWLFAHPTELTAPGAVISDIAASASGTDSIEKLHGLMAAIRARVAYVIGSTGPSTAAEEAAALGSGVCQDHAQIFVSAARRLGFPARYVSGYLMLNDRTDQVASHAWAEAYLDGLGWVSFDPSNGISTDERYVRIACGRDYRDAMPVSGITYGNTTERLEVRITVEQ